MPLFCCPEMSGLNGVFDEKILLLTRAARFSSDGSDETWEAELPNGSSPDLHLNSIIETAYPYDILRSSAAGMVSKTYFGFTLVEYSINIMICCSLISSPHSKVYQVQMVFSLTWYMPDQLYDSSATAVESSQQVAGCSAMQNTLREASGDFGIQSTY